MNSREVKLKIVYRIEERKKLEKSIEEMYYMMKKFFAILPNISYSESLDKIIIHQLCDAIAAGYDCFDISDTARHNVGVITHVMKDTLVNHQ
jgi:hypothetical protein